MSQLEEKIITLLKKERIHFERERSFPDLKRHGRHLRFDFYIPSQRALIEVQGAQHYHQVKKFQKKRSDFMRQQEYDRFKISWAVTHGYKLYIIPYWKVEKLTSAADLFSNEFRARSKWKNDLDWEKFQKV